MNHTRFSAFKAKEHEPLDPEVEQVLGLSVSAWNEIRKRLHEELGPLQEQWLFGGAFYGWSLRLRRKKKPVIYLCPRQGDFLASLAIDERTRSAALKLDFPDSIMEVLKGAHKYAEGYAIRFVITDAKQVEAVVHLVNLKHSPNNHNSMAPV